MGEEAKLSLEGTEAYGGPVGLKNKKVLTKLVRVVRECIRVGQKHVGAGEQCGEPSELSA